MDMKEIEKNNQSRIDLRKYNAEILFVNPVVGSISTQEKATTLKDLGEIIRQRVNELPTDAVYPAINALQIYIIDEKEKYERPQGNPFALVTRPALEGMDTYVTTLT